MEELTLPTNFPNTRNRRSESLKTGSVKDEKEPHDSKSNDVQILQDDERKPSRPAGEEYSTAKKYVLLIVFCLAQFLDAVNNSAIFPAIPTLAIDLNIKTNNTVWVISATQLTFASFLLLVSCDFISFLYLDF